jgi:twinkle protein
MADIRKFMGEQGWTWKEERRPAGLLGILNCPFCGDTEKKFAVNLDEGTFKCLHSNRCGVSGSFWQLQEMLGIKNPVRNDKDKFVYAKIKYERPKTHSEPLSSPATEYLKSRGFWDAIIKQFQIGQTKDEIMFPYFKNGELVNIKYRSLKEKKFRTEKNAEPSLFGRDFCKGDYVIICEGEFDAMAFSQMGEPAVSIPYGAKDTKWIEAEWDFLQGFQKIYLCFDNDAAGQENIFEVVKRLGKWRCYNVILPCKDANEWLLKDMSYENVKEVLNNAIHFDPEILKNASQFKSQVIELFEHPDTLHGLSTPWEKLDKILRGWRDGECTVLTGRNASGKTTLLNQVIIDLMKKKQNVLIASLEIPARRYLRWMVLNILQTQHPEIKDVDKTIDWIGEHLYILDVYGAIEPKDLLDSFDFAARKYGVNKFVIDSLLKIQFPGINDLKEQKEFINNCIDRLCKYHNAHVWLVAHPRKSLKDSDEPDKVDIEGTGAITNLADNVLIMTRKPAEKTSKSDNRLFIKKNREWGDEGFVNLKFDSNSKTFSEVLNGDEQSSFNKRSKKNDQESWWNE